MMELCVTMRLISVNSLVLREKIINRMISVYLIMYTSVLIKGLKNGCNK